MSSTQNTTSYLLHPFSCFLQFVLKEPHRQTFLLTDCTHSLHERENNLKGRGYKKPLHTWIHLHQSDALCRFKDSCLQSNAISLPSIRYKKFKYFSCSFKPREVAMSNSSHHAEGCICDIKKYIKRGALVSNQLEATPTSKWTVIPADNRYLSWH